MLLRLLEDIVSSRQYHHTVYLRAETLRSPGALAQLTGDAGLSADLTSMSRQVGDSETGLALLWSDDRPLAVLPPFPVEEDSSSAGADTSRLVELLRKDLAVGVVLLRLGQYAVGVVRGDSLLASKSGSRYVKSRHRAGGSSQRRFERSRERLVRELFDATCRVAREVLESFDGRIDYLLMGGERHTLQRFEERCAYLRRFASIRLGRRLVVGRPGRAALKRAHNEVWKSRVIVFTRGVGS